MCDVDPECTARDDPVALALLSSKRPARVTVRCDQGHKLAAVYDVGADHGGLVFCHRGTRELLTHVFGVQHLDVSAGRSYLHEHAEGIPLTELEARDLAHDESAEISLRCRCGSFMVDGADVGKLARQGPGGRVATATRRV